MKKNIDKLIENDISFNTLESSYDLVDSNKTSIIFFVMAISIFFILLMIDNELLKFFGSIFSSVFLFFGILFLAENYKNKTSKENIDLFKFFQKNMKIFDKKILFEMLVKELSQKDIIQHFNKYYNYFSTNGLESEFSLLIPEDFYKINLKKYKIEVSDYINMCNIISKRKNIHIINFFFSIEKYLKENLKPSMFLSLKYDILTLNIETYLKEDELNYVYLNNIHSYYLDNSINNKETIILKQLLENDTNKLLNQLDSNLVIRF